jgi:hypothetical protein
LERSDACAGWNSRSCLTAARVSQINCFEPSVSWNLWRVVPVSRADRLANFNIALYWQSRASLRGLRYYTIAGTTCSTSPESSFGYCTLTLILCYYPPKTLALYWVSTSITGRRFLISSAKIFFPANLP